MYTCICGKEATAKYCSKQCKRRAQNQRNYQRRKEGNQLAVNYIEVKKIIEIWYNSGSPAEAAEKLGISRQSLYSRKDYLKKQGIELMPLKSARKGRLTKPEIDSLIELNNKLSEQDKEQDGQV